MSAAPGAEVIHGSCVAFGGQGVVILGPSGAGKSGLALELMAMGAALVADDRVVLSARHGALIASAPPGLPALIEARGLGLLHAPLLPEAAVGLVVDLSRSEAARLPERRQVVFCGIAVDCVHGVVNRHFPAAIRQYMLHGRKD